MLLGAQVRQAGGFVAALRRAEAMGARCVQLFVQSNRRWHMPERPEEVFAAYRLTSEHSPVTVTVCHAPYLINVISPDADTADRSRRSLVANLRAATALGAAGLVLHPGSHRGVDPSSALERVARSLVDALDEAGARAPVCDLLLENTAGAGDTVGRSLDELAGIIDRAGADDRLGVCLDTQHLWASGVAFSTVGEADRLLRQVADTVGTARLRCLHLNDSKVPFGAQRDRHANLGDGTIGPEPLRALLGHPRLQGLPAVLEVPGVDGSGPRAADLQRAHQLHTEGLALRAHRRS